MDKPQNKYIAVAYKLYTVNDGKEELVEEATAERPFAFISGFGVTLDEFEKQVASLQKDAEFDFQLDKDKAYGDYEETHVLNLDRSIFSINGHFDHENIYKDAIVPLQNEDGNRFYGRVLDITDDKVKVDLNHPLAGKHLKFVGRILENRDATNQEIEMFAKHISGEGCGCGDCGGDDCCGEHHHDGGCGCGHCH